MLWNYRIFVGESPNYKYNAECAGSPYLADGSAIDSSSRGLEIWCNRSGEYVSLVRDYSDFPSMQSISICDFPIFGDATSALPTDILSRIDVSIYESFYFDIMHANYATADYPELSIRFNGNGRPDDLIVTVS